MADCLVSPALLSSSVRSKIDAWLKKYPPDQKQSAVIAALTYAQEDNGGWLPVPLMDAVAAYLGMPKIAVYEVATFYSLFELAPVGKHLINVCTNIACLLNGSEDIVTYLEKKLDISIGETSSDGKWTLKSVECLAACGGAPMMQIGKHYYECLTSSKIDTILAALE